MRFYQIKTTEKEEKPPRWYRTLVPSGITFSQLYVLLGYIHDKLQLGLSRYYEYETWDREIYIEEFGEDGPDQPVSFRDIYDTKGTYIDTFFRKGFKISQYTGRDFDLTIEVEEDAAEYQGLEAPQVIKVSRAIAYEEGGQPDGDVLPAGMFGIVVDNERYFRYSAELEDLIGSETIMHISADPVTPDESICKGRYRRGQEALHEAMLPLYEDEDLRPLIEQLESGIEDKQNRDPRVLQKINNQMLKKYGRTFDEYTFIASLRGLTEDFAKGQTGESTGRLDLGKKPKQPAVSTEDLVSSYSRDDLMIIAEDYNVILPANKTKKNLVKAVLQQLFTPESIRRRLMQLEDEEMELFRITAESEYGRFPETDNEEVNGGTLIDSLLAVPLKDDRLIVTDLLRNVYEESDKEKLEEDRQKTVWMYKCLEIARSFYGVMDWGVLRQLFARRYKKVSMDELKEVFRRVPDYYNDFEETGDKLVLRYYLEDDYYKYLEDRIQQDKPFYIPSRTEIEEFYEKGCLLSSSSHQAMYRFLVKNLGYEPEFAELKVMEIYSQINNGARMQTVLDNLGKDGDSDFSFNSEDDFKRFAQLYMDMNNRSHMLENRGYTPNDLFHAMGGIRSLPKDMTITPRGPEAAIMLNEARSELAARGIKIDEERVKTLITEEKNKKIGRNDPCPCGSGKKYKNCCGK